MTRNALVETSVPVRLIGKLVEYPATAFTVEIVNAVLLTPGETLP